MNFLTNRTLNTMIINSYGKEEYADWSEEERTVHRLRDGLREVVAEGSFGAGYLKKGE